MSKRVFTQILVLLSAVSQLHDFLPISHLTTILPTFISIGVSARLGRFSQNWSQFFPSNTVLVFMTFIIITSVKYYADFEIMF